MASERGRRFSHRTFRRGQALWRRGDRSAPLAFVLEGVVALTLPSGPDPEVAIGLRGPGSVVGWENVWRERAATQAVAVTDVEVCLGPATRLWASSSDRHVVALRALEEAIREIGLRSEEARERSGTARERLARFLLRQGERLLARGAQRVPLGWVARVLGMQAATLSRTLRDLRSRGVLGRGRANRVEVRDPEALRALAAGGRSDR